MNPRPKNPTKTRHIRVPVELDKRVEQEAAQNDRRYNGQVLYLLKLAIAILDKEEKRL